MNWKIQEFSKLSKFSIRTLHYYDEMNLLKPSKRQDNGYRLYTEKDLEKAEIIFLLKMCGFSLRDISTLLDEDVSEDVKRGFLWRRQSEINNQLIGLKNAQEAIEPVFHKYFLKKDENEDM